jgi:hypothetical protein
MSSTTQPTWDPCKDPYGDNAEHKWTLVEQAIQEAKLATETYLACHLGQLNQVDPVPAPVQDLDPDQMPVMVPMQSADSTGSNSQLDSISRRAKYHAAVEAFNQALKNISIQRQEIKKQLKVLSEIGRQPAP